MGSWSPVRAAAGKRDRHPARARGRRRVHLAAPGPDAVLTDRDAASAAQASQARRAVPPVPAWERFASVPVTSRRSASGDGDAVLTMACAGLAASRAVPAGPAPPQRPVRDYGTGPAYDLAGMRGC